MAVGATPAVNQRGHEILRCLTGKTRHQLIDTGRQKYSALPKFGNGVCVAATRPMEEGRIAIVTNAGRAAVDAGHVGAIRFCRAGNREQDVAQTTGVISVRQNRVVLAPGACAPSFVVMCDVQPGVHISDLQGDGGNSASLPGEITT
ncbi:hypothetical protein M2427_006388 [Bradyrhizobium sp. BR13661]|nr:hypothetical protein [Bradyrhizobium sp. BR13661]